MATEYAKNPHRGQRDIEDVAAFRQHLKRKGLRNLAEWEAARRATSPRAGRPIRPPSTSTSRSKRAT